MTEMESEVPMARGEQSAPAGSGGGASNPTSGHGVDATEPGPEARQGRHYRNEGDTGQFTRILGDVPPSTERPRRHRYREDDEENEVLTRILGH